MNLRALTDERLVARIEALRRRDRRTSLQILLHLAEIDRRQLHLKLGYQSLFHYCTSALRYSESAAGRRIQAARCAARFPRAVALFAAGDVNISTLSRIARILTEDNNEKLLDRIRGRSQREVEAIVAEFRPTARPRDRMRTVVVRVPAAPLAPVPAAAPLATGGGTGPAAGSAGLATTPPRAATASLRPATESLLAEDAAGANHTSTCDHSRNGSGESAQRRASPGEHQPPASTDTSCERVEKRTFIQFSAGESFVEKLERLRSIAWHRLPARASLEQVLELALDGYLERNDPLVRHQRRGRRSKESGPAARKTPCEPTDAGTEPHRTRHIPAGLRDVVFARDDGRCTYVGPGGRRCGSTTALQIDHIVPFCRGGRHTADNLRLLCGRHNRLEAERILGRHGTGT